MADLQERAGPRPVRSGTTAPNFEAGMSKMFFFPVVAWLLVVVGTTQAQMPELMPLPMPLEPAPTDVGQTSHLSDGSGPESELPAPPHLPPVPDDYILNRKCANCCGPLGGDGPVRSELYIQSGWSFPVGRGVFGDTLSLGWAIQAGARLMLFDEDKNGAWVVDMSGSNVWNQGRHPDIQFPFSILAPNAALGGLVQRFDFGKNGVPGVTVRDLNRTYVNLGFGRDWYLGGPASAGGGGGACAGGCGCGWNNCTWRLGVDGGGRYGTGSVEFHEIRHRSRVLEGVFVGAHADVEYPCGCCVFFGGIRTEWSYTWSQLLQQQSDIQEFELLFTAGVRY